MSATLARQVLDSAPPPPTEQGRLGAVDTLRGVAAVYVMMYHMPLLAVPCLAVPEWIKPLVCSGGTGVTLFFVLSAFTLCYSMSRRRDEPRPVLAFYVRRFFRIAPLFYSWMAVTYVRDVLVFGAWHSPGKVLLSLSFLFNLIPSQYDGFVWASWTLGIEMLFYVMFPLFFRFASNLPRAVGLFFGMATGASVFQLWVAPRLADFPGRAAFLHAHVLHMLPAFAMGIVAFHAYERYIRGRDNLQSWSWALVLGGVYGYNALLSQQLNLGFDPLYWQAIVYAAMLLGLLCTPWRLVVNGPTRFLGDISYSLYLNHPTLVFFLSPAYRAIYALPAVVTVRWGLCAALTLAVVTLVSVITHRTIEKPGMRLGSWLMRRYMQPAAAAAPSTATPPRAPYFQRLHVVQADRPRLDSNAPGRAESLPAEGS